MRPCPPATFHWIPDHDRLFRNLARVLRSGGQLEARCGGAGNVAELTAVVRTLGHDIDRGKVHAGPEETGARSAWAASSWRCRSAIAMASCGRLRRGFPTAACTTSG
jgi:hypothetical protein